MGTYIGHTTQLIGFIGQQQQRFFDKTIHKTEWKDFFGEFYILSANNHLPRPRKYLLFGGFKEIWAVVEFAG
jgi:hypothetical protein